MSGTIPARGVESNSPFVAAQGIEAMAINVGYGHAAAGVVAFALIGAATLAPAAQARRQAPAARPAAAHAAPARPAMHHAAPARAAQHPVVRPRPVAQYHPRPQVQAHVQAPRRVAQPPHRNIARPSSPALAAARLPRPATGGPHPVGGSRLALHPAVGAAALGAGALAVAHTGTARYASLPHLRAVTGQGLIRSRLAVPANLRPRLTLVRGPSVGLVPRFSPFVQRHWRRAFFWVAVGGIGYLTIPEDYYAPFLDYVSAPVPRYDAALDLLSLAALQDEGPDRVVYAMPATAQYRYRASVAPGPNAVVPSQPVCSLSAFVERKWNRQFSWVLIPEMGNVTVPDDQYDRFYQLVGTTPPNYAAACTVLAQAAAAETVAQSSPE